MCYRFVEEVFVLIFLVVRFEGRFILFVVEPLDLLICKKKFLFRGEIIIAEN